MSPNIILFQAIIMLYVFPFSLKSIEKLKKILHTFVCKNVYFKQTY